MFYGSDRVILLIRQVSYSILLADTSFPFIPCLFQEWHYPSGDLVEGGGLSSLRHRVGDARAGGLEIVSFGVSSVKASDEDEETIKELQGNAAFRGPTMAGTHMAGAQAEDMQSAAASQGTRPVMGFMGMGLAVQAGGMNAQNLYAMGQQQQQQQQQPSQSLLQQAQEPVPAGWTCLHRNHTRSTGKSCMECGKPNMILKAKNLTLPILVFGWGRTINTSSPGKFYMPFRTQA